MKISRPIIISCIPLQDVSTIVTQECFEGKNFGLLDKCHEIFFSSPLQGWRIIDNCSLNKFIFTVHGTHNSTNSNQVLTY